MKLSTSDSALKGAYSMPVGITTNVNCGLGKSKSKGQPGKIKTIAHLVKVEEV